MYLELHTSRLTLRPLSTNDLSTTHKYATNLDVTKYMIYLPNHSIEETLGFLQQCEAEWNKDQPDDYEFAICLDGKHIGAISLSRVNQITYEFGWILDSVYQGRGFVTESAQELVRFAKSLGAKELIAHCDTRNVASRRVMEKLGMKLVLEQERQYTDERGFAREYEYKLEL